MTFPIQHPWQLTTEFYKSCSLSQAPENCNHPHGAWDCTCSIETPILAPEDGKLGAYVAYRPRDSMYFKQGTFHPRAYRAFRNYFYDTFGLIYIVWGISELVHLFAHSFNSPNDHHWTVVEEHPAQRSRRPLLSYQAQPRTIREKQIIGVVGNAGWSTDPHLHYEIHKSPWQTWIYRPNPADIYYEQWITHRHDLSYDYHQEQKRWI